VFRNRTISGKFRNLIENITDVHVDFDIIDESMLETLTINKSKLVNDNVSYSMIIVPQMDSLSKEAANKIIDFADNNGHIMFVNERPIYIEGAKCELAESIRSIKAIEIQNNRGIWQKYFKSAPVQDSFSLLDERLNDEVSGVATYFGSLNSNYVAYLFNHKLGHSINAVIRKKGNYKISVYNPLNNTNQLLESSFYGKYTYANITINSYNGILLMIEENAENTVFVSKRLVEHNVLKTDGVSLSDYNALTLDYGQFSINNGEFSEKKAVIHMVDQIYRELSSIKTDSNVTIKFEFNIDFKTTIKRELNLVTEEVEGLDITVNGTTVTESKKWWIDKGFRVFDICDLVKNESNTIVLNYKIPKQNKLHDITNKFESERNRFYYAIEPENIYIYGDFDVDYKGVPLKMSTHYCLPCKPCENSFYITDSTSKQIGDLTTQGLWFYRGNAEYTSTFNYQTDNEVKLRLDNPSCTFAKPFVNNQIAGIILNKNDSVNITDLLKKGENQIKVEIYGHNRNLFGPHHHFKGQNFFVGPSTFIGTKGFEDFVSSDIVEKNTWTDNYSFVPFTCGSIVLEMYK